MQLKKGLFALTFGWLYSLVSFVINWAVSKCYVNQILFNCAWEDPRIDLEAMQMTDKDNVLIITTAGCNVLSLAINNPNHIYTIDRNSCQNALLELKIAAIRELDYKTFWQLFGTGRLNNFSKLHYPRLRQHLSLDGRAFWDTHSHYFNGTGLRPSFYWRGCSGLLAWLVVGYLRMLGLYAPMLELMSAKTVEEQKVIYQTRIEKRMWNPLLMWILGSSGVLALLNGVPEAQQELLAKEGGYPTVGHFIKGQVDTILCRLPVHDNYFYRVYLTGEYTKECCPDYLTEDGFNKLKGGMLDKISIHTTTITEFLREHKKKDISRFVLLDHMDWMASSPKVLSEEWQEMIESATDDARFLWRSASIDAAYVGEATVKVKDAIVPVKDLFKFDYQLAARLHEVDRVHTYASFFIADLAY